MRSTGLDSLKKKLNQENKEYQPTTDIQLIHISSTAKLFTNSIEKTVQRRQQFNGWPTFIPMTAFCRLVHYHLTPETSSDFNSWHKGTGMAKYTSLIYNFEWLLFFSHYFYLRVEKYVILYNNIVQIIPQLLSHDKTARVDL